MIEKITSRFPVSIGQGACLLINNKKVLKAEITKAIAALDLPPEDVVELISDPNLFDKLKDYAVSVKAEAKEAKEKEKEDKFQELVDNYRVFSVLDEQSQSTSLGYVVYDSRNDTLGATSYSHLTRLYGRSLMESFPVEEATLKYDPTATNNKNKIKEIGGVNYLNKYRVPAWREMYYLKHLTDERLDVKLPDLADEFMKHLFPKPEVLHYVYLWLYHAMTQFHGNIETLVIQGIPGSGKSVFAENLVRSLFGDNAGGYMKSPKSSLGQFQASLIDRRLVVMDEFKIEYKTYDSFKMLSNNRVTFERKRIDADKEYTKYYSFIATLNESSDWYVTQDDRRSSIIEITDKRLEDVWPTEKIDELVDRLDNDERFIYEIGRYILGGSWCSEEQIPPLRQYKSAKFYHFVYESLFQWQKDFIHFMFSEIKMNNKEIDLTDYTTPTERKKRPVGIGKLEDFIKKFLYQGEHKLGEVVLDEDEENQALAAHILKINPYFLGEEE